MKLSEAILLGSTMGPQIYGEYQRSFDSGSCALGAAGFAIGFRVGCRVDVSNLVDNWLWLRTTYICPECVEIVTFGSFAVLHI